MSTQITLAQAQAHLDAWIAADLAVALGQEYSIGGRSLRRVDVPQIRQQIGYWSQVVRQFTTATDADAPSHGFAVADFR